MKWISGDALSLFLYRRKYCLEERRRISQRLREIANDYERDGKPGPKAYNVWGWREIARELRRVADEVDKC